MLHLASGCRVGKSIEVIDDVLDIRLGPAYDLDAEVLPPTCPAITQGDKS